MTDVEKRLNNFKKKFGENRSYRSLLAKYLLSKIDLEDRLSKKNDTLEKLNKEFLNVKKDYSEIKKSKIEWRKEGLITII